MRRSIIVGLIVASFVSLLARADQINIAAPAWNAATTWTVTDQSGAALTFTSVTGDFVRMNRTCVGTLRFTFPSTADATVSKISLPCTVNNNGNPAIGSCFTTTAAAANAHQIMLGLANTTTAQFVNSAGGTTQPQNSALTLATVTCAFHFVTS